MNLWEGIHTIVFIYIARETLEGTGVWGVGLPLLYSYALLCSYTLHVVCCLMRGRALVLTPVKLV